MVIDAFLKETGVTDYSGMALTITLSGLFFFGCMVVISILASCAFRKVASHALKPIKILNQKMHMCMISDSREFNADTIDEAVTSWQA